VPSPCRRWGTNITDTLVGAAATTRIARVPYRDAVFYLGVLALLVAPAFWPTYFFPPKYESDWHVHVHGVAMFGWIALLVTQAALVRNHRPAHRALGKASFVLVPLIVLSTLSLAHHRMQQGLNADLLYFFYLQVCLLLLFVVSYGLAIANRRRRALHARYMVCTALAVVDPIVARLFYIYGGIDYPHMQLMSFALIDGILVLLLLRDMRSGLRPRVFPAMLAFFVATQVPTFFLHETAAWRGFVAAFAALPIP
jgi:hypothetical protein